MSRAPKYCECGRKILVPTKRRMDGDRPMPKRATRSGRLPKHDLCRECWRKLGLRA